MTNYEVFIPAASAHDYDTTLTVSAQDWLGALRLALGQLGERLYPGMTCRMQRGRRLRVHDTRSQRVFVVQPVDDVDDDELATHSGQFDTLELSASERAALLESNVDEVSSPTPPGGSQVLRARREPSGSQPRIPLPRPLDERLVERVLVELRWAYASPRSFQEVAAHLLTLAVELIPCAAGAVLFPDLRGKNLHFASVLGVDPAEVRSLSVPLDQGVASICIREGFSLAVDDAREDPRLAPALTHALGLPARSVLCAPLLHEGRVYGVIELLDRDASPSRFESADQLLLVHIGSYLARFIATQL